MSVFVNKNLTFRRISSTPVLFMIIPVIVVFQYKYCSGFNYKMFSGNCFETQIYFCKLTLRSNTYWKIFIHIHDIHITWFVFFPRLKFMLGFNTNFNIFPFFLEDVQSYFFCGTYKRTPWCLFVLWNIYGSTSRL